MSAQALLGYFQPLEEYFEKAPLTQASYSTTPKTVTTSTTTTTTAKPKERRKSKFDRKTPKNVTELTEITVNETQRDEAYKNIVKDNTQLVNTGLSDKGGSEEASQPHKAVIFAALGVLVCVLIIVVSVVLRKKLRRKRKTNNRRFET